MKTFNEIRESSKDVLLKRYHKYKDKQMSPAEAQQFRQLVRKLKAMGVSLKEETVEEKFKVSYKDKGSYSVVFRNKNGKVESEVRADSKEKAEKQAALRNKRVKPSEGAWEVVRTNESVEESTQAYGKSQEKIRDKKKKDAISSSDKEKLAKLKKMMSKEDLDESLRKSIAQNSGKFPEGSTVKCKKSGKTGKVLTVGKDFVKVAVGNKQIDYKPSELELVKESVHVDEARVTPGDLKAQAEGKKAAKAGKKYEDNPYEKGTSRHLQWAKGHNSWREKNESSDLDEALKAGKGVATIEVEWNDSEDDKRDDEKRYRGIKFVGKTKNRLAKLTGEKKAIINYLLKGYGLPEVEIQDFFPELMESVNLDENKKPHPQGSAKFYRGAMDKYKAKTPKKSHWDMYMDKKRTKKEGNELDEAKESGMDIARRIVKDKQHEKGVDMQTANFILQVYNKVNDANKKKMDGSSLKQLVSLAQRMMKK
jgi:hypothetical protein